MAHQDVLGGAAGAHGAHRGGSVGLDEPVRFVKTEVIGIRILGPVLDAEFETHEALFPVHHFRLPRKIDFHRGIAQKGRIFSQEGFLWSSIPSKAEGQNLDLSGFSGAHGLEGEGQMETQTPQLLQMLGSVSATVPLVLMVSLASRVIARDALARPWATASSIGLG